MEKYMTVDEKNYSVFKVKCYCCKKETNCKLIDKRLVCKKCNHIDENKDYIDIVLPDYDDINEDGTFKK